MLSPEASGLQVSVSPLQSVSLSFVLFLCVCVSPCVVLCC